MSAIISSSSSTHSLAFKVYYRHRDTLITVKFRETQLTVEQVIQESISILMDRYMLKINQNYILYALFPANSKGEKVADAMEVCHTQRIKGTGVKRFFLENVSLSKESISTQINL